jgi:phosphoglucomutase
MKRRTGSFRARGSDGRAYTVEVWTKFRSASTAEGPGVEVAGRTELYTSSGAHVVRAQKGEYRIVATGVTLRPDGPGAV